jgi:hypothetical protein
MAYDTAYLENPRTGQIRTAPIGFSWTMFFFGFFPPLFRGDWKWFAIMFFAGFALALISLGLLGWVPGIIGAFIWNKSYLQGLIREGFQLRSTASGNLGRIDGEAGFQVPRITAAGWISTDETGILGKRADWTIGTDAERSLGRVRCEVRADAFRKRANCRDVANGTNDIEAEDLDNEADNALVGSGKSCAAKSGATT